jgi:two-component system, chemotaxis family, response regulator Rcp1
MTPSRILLVEDNPGDIYLLEKALTARGLGYELMRFDDGEQAMRAIESDGLAVPDLILLDLNLPRREGIDVLKAIRGKPSFVGVPVGILTSSDDARDRHRVALIGAERYIHKPPMLEEFLEQVGSAVAEMLGRS